MSGYAQLVEWQIEEHAVNQESCDNLKVITDEALRLSKLVTRSEERRVGKEC